MLLLLHLQVLASCLWLGRSEVVTSFEISCPWFFFQERTPNNALQPNNPAWICQRYNNRYYFATLYNRDLRIPVYSAYIYNPGTGPRPSIWMVEPQLIDSKYPRTMQTEIDLIYQSNVTLQEIRNSQAIFQDYTNLTDLNRGHLNPSGHQPDTDSMTATFTLTNIVPQNQILNSGAWNNYEEITMANMSQGCKKTYVVVGAVPGNNYIASRRVNIPDYIWSSACCDLGNNQSRAWAALAKNTENDVQLLKLGQLEKRLTEFYGKGQVYLFHPGCPRQ